MDNDTYYTLLGVSSQASADDIKRAYRRLILEHHPDRNPGNPDAAIYTASLNAAVEVLFNGQQRALYDAQLRSTTFAVSPHEYVEDRADDATYDVQISFSQARDGVTHLLRFHNASGQPYAVNVVVPAGAHHGLTIRILGAGGPSRSGARRGDLVVTVRVAG